MRVVIALAGLLLALGSTVAGRARAEVTSIQTGGFEIEHVIIVPGNPETVYAELTGDVSGWWDHTMSEHPARLFVDARPGGGFYEWFDEEGENGVQHARVIYADAGHKLTLVGPLGLSGHAIELVYTYELEPIDPHATKVTLTARAAGEIQDGWPELVDGVWHHFMVERFQPFMENLAAGGR